MKQIEEPTQVLLDVTLDSWKSAGIVLNGDQGQMKEENGGVNRHADASTRFR